MATPTDAPRTPRVPLTRERVLRAAVDLADSSGIAALTMRRLGQTLGVEAMSLYNHVANKDDILAGIVELVFSEVELPAPDDDWKAGIRRSAISAHAALRRHTWAYHLTMAPDRVSPARLRWMEAVLRALRQAGFSAELSCHAYHALDSHVTGFALWLASFPALGQELQDLAATFLQQLPVADYPYVVEHIHQHLAPPDPDAPSAFEFGLDLILDGLERLRDTG